MVLRMVGEYGRWSRSDSKISYDMTAQNVRSGNESTLSATLEILYPRHALRLKHFGLS